jgi:peptidoglycan/xylan/chitin deacetylase (PgdA/CDA1 family)
MYDTGHQLASHTGTHEDLTQLPANLVQNQVIYNEMAFRNIFGLLPRISDLLTASALVPWGIWIS